MSTLDEIRERDAWYGPDIGLYDRGSVSDRRIVLRILDETTLTAAHLLAHQQARGILRFDRLDAIVKDVRAASLGLETSLTLGFGARVAEQNAALIDERNALRAELARKDAEIGRLKEVLRELVKWGRPFEGTPGHSLFDRWMERADEVIGSAALGEEVRDA